MRRGRRAGGTKNAKRERDWPGKTADTPATCCAEKFVHWHTWHCLKLSHVASQTRRVEMLQASREAVLTLRAAVGAARSASTTAAKVVLQQVRLREISVLECE